MFRDIFIHDGESIVLARPELNAFCGFHISLIFLNDFFTDFLTDFFTNFFHWFFSLIFSRIFLTEFFTDFFTDFFSHDLSSMLYAGFVFHWFFATFHPLIKLLWSVKHFLTKCVSTFKRSTMKYFQEFICHQSFYKHLFKF